METVGVKVSTRLLIAAVLFIGLVAGCGNAAAPAANEPTGNQQDEASTTNDATGGETMFELKIEGMT
jgi:hypothetical protein